MAINWCHRNYAGKKKLSEVAEYREREARGIEKRARVRNWLRVKLIRNIYHPTGALNFYS